MTSSGSAPIIRLIEHLASAPYLLHYTITSPSHLVIDGDDFENQWVFQAQFLDDDGITIHTVVHGHVDIATGLVEFTGKINEYLNTRTEGE